MSVTPNLTTVADTGSSTTLIAENASRKGLTIHNNSSAILYLRFSATAAATVSTGCNVQIPALGTYDFPQFPTRDGFEVYRGEVRGIWASDSTGSAQITEWV